MQHKFNSFEQPPPRNLSSEWQQPNIRHKSPELEGKVGSKKAA
jgi:hypothetical protein